MRIAVPPLRRPVVSVDPRLARRNSRATALAAAGLVLALVVEAGLPAAASATRTPVTRAPATRTPATRTATIQLPGPTLAADPSGGLQPTIQYEEAMAHAADRNTFVPGDRVSVPFQPRAGDAWPVGGVSPRVLPAGRATGQAMAGTPQGHPWASAPPPPPSPDPGAPGRGAAGGRASVDLPTVPAGTFRAEAVAAVVPPTRDPLASAALSGLRRQVFGFLPYWELGDSSTTLNYGLLSTIAYFSVGVDANGNLLKQNPDGTTTTGWGGWTSSSLTTVIDAAHASGTRVVLTVSVFAWSTGQANVQSALLDSPTARANLANQAAAAVRDRGADGINLDFEPIVSGRADEFTALVRSMRAALDAIAPGYQLTFDTTGWIGNYPIEDATGPGGADAIFIMGYDYRTASASQAGSVAPLNGPVYDITDTVLAYTARVPASKLILGVPYYGRAWSTSSNGPNAPTQTGTQFGASATPTYDAAMDFLAQYGRNWDPIEQVAWTAYQRQNCTTTYGCVTTWRELYVDDVQALQAKYDLVNRAGLRGVGIWALGYDGTRPELWQALYDKFLRDTTAPEAGISPLPATEPDEGFSVTWVGADDQSVASYDVQVSTDGGPWTAWLTGTTATSEVWLGADGHTYAFRVRALDNRGNWSAWNIGDTGVTPAGVAPAGTAPAGTAPAGTAPAGTAPAGTAPAGTAPAGLAPGGFGRVASDQLSLRGGPDTSATRLGTANAGDLLAIAGGPVSADGYAWYEVTGPISSWGTVGFVRVGAWVATSGAGGEFVTAVPAPNTTHVQAGIAGLSFGDAGPASLGPAAASMRVLSPNGDGWNDTLRLRWTNGVALDTLLLRVLRPDGSLVGAVDLVGQRAAGPQSYDWDGTAGGAVVPDGQYLLQLVGTAAGTTYSAPSTNPATPAQIARYAVAVDTVPPTAGPSSISSPAFSPNGDGRLDTVVVTGGATGATRFALLVAPLAGGVAGAPIRMVAGGTRPDGSVTVAWDGRADDGTAVADGTYRVTLRVMDAAGNATPSTWDVTLDTQAPVLVASVTPARISPNGDGVDDRTTIAWSSDTPVAGWVRVLRGTTLLRRWSQPLGPGASITWDGRDASGRAAPDGRYTVEVDLSDPAGNRVLRQVALAVDRTAGFLRVSPGAFYPQDRDGLVATTTVSYRITRTATATLRITAADGTVVRTAWSGRRQWAGAWTWTWDGRDARGTFVPAGRYVAVLTVVGPFGTTVLSRTVIADAFIVTPSAATLAAGQTLTLAIRSVEPLKAPPTVTLAQAGLAPVSVIATAAAGGTWTASVTIAAGGPGPATLTVEGRDAAGRLNRSSLTVGVE